MRAACAVLVTAAALEAGSVGAAARVADPVPGHPERRANVVFVLADDLTTDLVRFMPTVRRMQRRGVSFDEYVATDSLCCTSRASILTGEYPHSHRVLGNLGPGGGWQAFHLLGAERRSVALPLRRAGYRTALYGKYLNGYRRYEFVPPGWTDWFVSDRAYRQFGYDASVNGRVRRFGHRRRDYNTDVIARRGAAFIRAAARRRRPFFAYLAPFTPHPPVVPAPRHRHLFRKLALPRGPSFGRPTEGGASYLVRRPMTAHEVKSMTAEYRRRVRSVQAIDELVARAWAAVRHTRRTADTYLVFSSDNGYHMGQHNMRPGKASAYDTDVRVPLVVVGPGLPAGARVGAPAANIDLAPTFWAMAGLAPSTTVDGRSLLALARGNPPTVSGWRSAVLLEHWHSATRPSDPDHQTTRAGLFSEYRALRTPTGTYVRFENHERELFDRTTDPWELRNRVGELPVGEVGRLDVALDRYASCRGVRDCDAAGQVTLPVLGG